MFEFIRGSERTFPCLVRYMNPTPSSNWSDSMVQFMGTVFEGKESGSDGKEEGVRTPSNMYFWRNSWIIRNPTAKQIAEEKRKKENDPNPQRGESGREESPASRMLREMRGSLYTGPTFDLSGMFETGKEEAKPEPAATESVAWEDVLGLEDAKTALKEAIEAPYLYSDIYKHFGMSPPKGVLLYGPPGCGKTMLGKAAVSAMASVHKRQYRDGFFYYSCGEMLGPGWADEANFIKNAFKKAEEFKSKHGYPAVLFFDECDIMLPDRKHANYFVKNAVNIFLSKMDGMDSVNCFIILATNNHQELDEAAIRAGRIDRKIYVGRPNKEVAASIVGTYLKKKPIKKSAEVDALVQYAIREIFSEKKLCKGVELFNLLNGAMLKGVVENAAAIAFRNACLAKLSEGFSLDLHGIGEAEIEKAVLELYLEQKNLREKAPDTPSEMADRVVSEIKKISGENGEIESMTGDE